MPWLRWVLTLLAMPLAVVLAVPAAVGCSLASLGHACWREGLRSFAGALVNLPWDLAVNTLGWWQCLAAVPLYWGRAEQPGAGWVGGSLCFRGGLMGRLVATFADALTLSSTFFISGAAWQRRSPEQRDELVNHELWHVRHHLRRYTFLWFWPAYLYANLRHGIHRRNPWESGPLGPYRWVVDRWEEFKESAEYVPGRQPFWF